jgi:hypothetical protein
MEPEIRFRLIDYYFSNKAATRTKKVPGINEGLYLPTPKRLSITPGSVVGRLQLKLRQM